MQLSLSGGAGEGFADMGAGMMFSFYQTELK